MGFPGAKREETVRNAGDGEQPKLQVAREANCMPGAETRKTGEPRITRINTDKKSNK